MINPFRDAMEYMEWIERNCCNCKKYQPEVPFDETVCEIERAVSLIPFVYGVDEALYRRMGASSGHCTEKESDG